MNSEVTDHAPPIRACIFDLDGLLINSEDIYTEIYNEILRAHDKKPLMWTTKGLQMSRGQIGHERILSAASLPLSVDEFRAETATHSHRFRESKPLPGVLALLSNLASASPAISLAIASSTSSSLFETKTAHLPDLTAHFSRRCILLADDEDMKDKKGKPAGDVFLLAMERMNAALVESSQGKGEEAPKLLTPEECLVFEDSIAGVAAGRAAGMRVCWVPHDGLQTVCRGLLCHVVQGQIETVERELIGRQGGKEDLEATSDGGRGGKLTRMADGEGEMLRSLENFYYGFYGIGIPSSWDEASYRSASQR
ncbi:MAG: hypothetical protein Q9222_002807 [Ikaeria aurantiellina]